MCVHNRRKKKEGVMWWRKISHVPPHKEGILLLLLFVEEWGERGGGVGVGLSSSRSIRPYSITLCKILAFSR